MSLKFRCRSSSIYCYPVNSLLVCTLKKCLALGYFTQRHLLFEINLKANRCALSAQIIVKSVILIHYTEHLNQCKKQVYFACLVSRLTKNKHCFKRTTLIHGSVKAISIKCVQYFAILERFPTIILVN